MPIPVTPVVVRFGALDQKKAPKHTVLGTLTEAKNVRQRKLGRYEQRYGCSPMSKTADSGSITSGTGLASTPDALVLHSDDVLWTRDEPNTQWLNRGAVTRCWPTDTAAIDLNSAFPFSVVSGTKVFHFAMGSGVYYYRVTDLNTGVELKARTTVTATSISRMRPIVVGGYVWLFWSTSAASSNVTLHKYDPSSLSTAAVSTNYQVKSAGAGTTMVWDVASYNTPEQVFFVSKWNDTVTITGGAGLSTVWRSYLDPTTGLANASPGWVGSSPVTASTSPIACINGQDADKNYVHIVCSGTTAGANEMELVRLFAGALTEDTTIWQTTGVGAVGRSLSGFHSGATNIYVYVSDVSDGANPGTESARNAEDATITLHTWDGATRTEATFLKGHFTASQPFKVSSTWYTVVGHDDFDDLQRSYLVVNAITGKIVARTLYDRGGNAMQTGQFGTGIVQSHTAVTVSSNKAYLSLLQSDSPSFWTTRFITLDFAHTYGPLRSIVNDRQVILPGAWPQRLSAQDSAATEIVPMMYPSTPAAVVSVAASSLAAGTFGFKATYLQVDAAGNEYRSGASIATTGTTAGANTDTITVTVRTLRQTNGATPITIELWMTAVGGSTYFLHSKTANSTTANTVAFTVTSAPATGAEELYTTGGVLSNYPPPPFRFCFQFKNRLWVSDTDREGETWHSKEYVIGKGPEFASPLKVNSFSGRSRTRAGGAINADYAALFTELGWFAVSGQGPDDTGGGGSFALLRGGDEACTAPSSVVTGQRGCYFQRPGGVVAYVTPGLQVVDSGAAALDYASLTVVGAVHLPEEACQEVRLRMSDGKCLVHDYGNSNPNAPDGYWYVDTSSTYGAAVASCVFNNLEHFVESDGEVWKEVESQYFDGTSTVILPLVKFEAQFSDLLGNVKIRRGLFLGNYVSAHTMTITVTPDIGSASAHAITGANPTVWDFRPTGCSRIASCTVQVERTGTGTGAGFQFEGMLFEVQSRGRGLRVNSAQRI